MEREVLRPTGWRFFVALTLAQAALALAPWQPAWMRVVWGVLAVGNLCIWVVPSLTLTPDAMVVRGVRGRRSVAWGDVDRLQSPPRGTAFAVLRGGERLRLPVHPNAASRVAEWSARHGHRVEVEV